MLQYIVGVAFIGFGMLLRRAGKSDIYLDVTRGLRHLEKRSTRTLGNLFVLGGIVQMLEPLVRGAIQ